MYLGIDIGGTKIQCAYLRGDTVVITAKLATPGSYEPLLAALADIVAGASAATGEPVTHLGVGVPGTVTVRQVTWTPNLPYLDGQPLANDLGERLGAEAMVGNDAQFALLGEAWRGAASAYQNVALVSVGTGVGGAIMMNGKIARGNHGSAGAFGWLNLDLRAAPDPNHGYTELHASGAALDAMAQALDPPRTSYEVVAEARAGDAVYAGLVDELAKTLGTACASIASILDPDVILLSGGLTDAFDLLETPLRASLHAYGSPSVRETPIVVGKLGRHAAAYGALRAAMLQHAVWE